MADTAALSFLNGIFDEDITLTSYRKARTRPKKLFRHPEFPIRKIQWLEASGSQRDKSSGGGNHFCTPILKTGWSISEGCLVQCGG
jgi:hypothetical protein